MRNEIALKIRFGAALVAMLMLAEPALARGVGGGGGFHGGGEMSRPQPYSGRASSGGFDFGNEAADSHTGSHGADDTDGYDTANQYNASHSAYNDYNHQGSGDYNHNAAQGYNDYNHNGYAGGNNYNHNVNNGNNYNHYGNNYNNVAIVNPRGYNTWGWHGGVAWAPVGTYWGGGFWGPFAAGAIVAGVTVGMIAATSASYPNTYPVAQSSPGYTLLNDYGLRQVPCGPGVVVMNYSGSVICAAPNSTVAAGNYSVNIGTLTLVSM